MYLNLDVVLAHADQSFVVLTASTSLSEARTGSFGESNADEGRNSSATHSLEHENAGK
jgi:hypothetical protein